MVCRFFCVLCLALLGTSLLAASKDEAAVDSRAAELVVRALEAGLTGDLERRGELLAEEARLHWQGVLFFNANHAEAIKALGLHKFRDRWLTATQIDRVKQNEQEFEKARDQWKARLQRLVETVEHRPSGRDEALTQL